MSKGEIMQPCCCIFIFEVVCGVGEFSVSPVLTGCDLFCPVQDVLCHRIEESLVKVRAEVEPLVSKLVCIEEEVVEYVKRVEPHISHFLQTLEEVVATFRKAITFMLMKVRVQHGASIGDNYLQHFF